MKHLFLFLFLTAALFHGTPSLCDTAKDDDAEELKQAVEPIKKAAEQGDITAQYKLGVLYSQGIGMEQDNAKACRWYRKAAEQGDMKAQYMLGRMYYNGEGVPQDFVKARQWWEKAADRGNPSAQVSIGAMYEHGEGVKKDLAAAREWYDKACGRGFKEGCTELERLNRK